MVKLVPRVASFSGTCVDALVRLQVTAFRVRLSAA